MARLDVARIKILTSTWEFIDMALKVEVEGACFDLWVIEERGRVESLVGIDGVMGEEGSVVAPFVASGEVGVVDEAVAVNSGEDDTSGNEEDGDVRVALQHGGRHETRGVPLFRNQKRFNPLVAPKCVQLAEAVKESGVKSRRRKTKGVEVMKGVVTNLEDGGNTQSINKEGEFKSPRTQQRKMAKSGKGAQVSMPASGLLLILGEFSSSMMKSVAGEKVVDKEEWLEAAKLLSIQKDRGRRGSFSPSGGVEKR
ncbi:hypothetical protein TSUD_296820 [Trifolium subterraneum]|uniref:Uncharacterized protein n=1 Tax=Trifolium subterraneum TaxID=3900 RepID=A0A2Z6NXE2_TRISU|nr:hypothetical protein TSUD_296820 [Trifolium subterraneum]